MAKIENFKYSVSEAFNECFYIVPDYQREYVWTDKEVEELLEDIDEQMDGDTGREYFIGTVLVSQTGHEERNHYELIDGQQRLTTLFLLLCALRERFHNHQQVQALNPLISSVYVDKEGNTRASLKLEPRYENAAEVVSKIVETNSDPATVRARIRAAGVQNYGSLEKPVNAYDTIYQHLKDNYPDDAELRKYWGYLANEVVFIQISTDLGNALKIFETINERGVSLNPMDLLKNLLFRQVSNQQFAVLRDEWKRITKPLEKANEKPLRFLRYFLMANYEIRIKRGDKTESVLREDQIYDWLTEKQNAARCEYTAKPFEFARKIIHNVDYYLDFARGYGNDGAPSIAMDNVKRLSGGAFSLHQMLLLASAHFPKRLFDYFVEQLESFLFYYIFTETPTKELERNFSIWADELRAIGELSDVESQREKLNHFVADHFQKGMLAKEQALTDALRRYTLDSMQQYRTRYLLSKLTQFVDMAYKGQKTPGPLSEYATLEIEHILPDKPQASLLEAWAHQNLGAPYDKYKIKLGNLTLLEKPINIVASNDFFSQKKQEYTKSQHYLTSSIAGINVVGKNSSINRINTKLKAFDHWTAVSIDERQELLIGLAREVWKTAPLDSD
jgi:uncharacterized protein with ParB-like and HNH nuclease domain